MSNVKFDKWLNPADGSENYKCRAWVNFNGTGTVAIRASGNVSSITDNGTGDYTVNFTNAMTDANYSAVASNQTPSGALARTYVGNGISAGSVTAFDQQTANIRLLTYGTAANDCAFVHLAIFR